MIRDKGRYLSNFKGNQDILFVRAGQDILIAPDEDKSTATSDSPPNVNHDETEGNGQSNESRFDDDSNGANRKT
ncbi:MAG: hypothetical protein IPP40_15880 [bacterium]|nr:hypothetical protein [bacterium]